MKRKSPIILFTAFSLAFILAVYAMMSGNSHPHSSKHNAAMKKIFLCSSFYDVASLLPKSFSVPLKGKTVAFIPTASIHAEYTQYVEEGKAALDSLGLLVKDLEITQHDTKEIARCLEDCDYIYVSGGQHILPHAGTQKDRSGQIDCRTSGKRQTIYWRIGRDNGCLSQYRIRQKDGYPSLTDFRFQGA